MRLPASVNKEDRVNILIRDLKLTKWSETTIGGELIRGVSGGERKRTSIGVELITDPSLIFLDEPTTGLDSFTATNIVEILSDLANSGRTVVWTIHQPNSDIFNLLDQLMLIANGKTLYFNDAKLATGYFKTIGYGWPQLMNPLDYYIDLLSLERTNLEIELENNPNYDYQIALANHKEKIDKIAVSDLTPHIFRHIIMKVI